MKYQDLVIKDGKFIGEFEKMYQKFDDPWNQSSPDILNNSFSRQAVINYIKKFNIKTVVEFGCGLGHTSNLIINKCDDLSLIGVDITKTAIEKARINFPSIEFKNDNILNINDYSATQCIFLSEILWYILKDSTIDKVFTVLKKNFKGKYLIIQQTFYKGQQRYGLDYFSNLDELIRFCPFELLSKVICDYSSKNSYDTTTIFKI